MNTQQSTVGVNPLPCFQVVLAMQKKGGCMCVCVWGFISKALGVNRVKHSVTDVAQVFWEPAALL